MAPQPSKFANPPTDAFLLQTPFEGLLATLRGFRNGIVCGGRVRLPYVLNALAFFVLFRGQGEMKRVHFVFQQLFFHGRNLGLFVFIYKSICWLLRKYLNIRWIAGAISGWFAFGQTAGISGAVNNQIVLYLFARGLEGSIRSLVKRGWLPQILDVRQPSGFRILTAFALGLIMFLTEYEPETLRPGFMSVMTNLYHETDPPQSMFPTDLKSYFPVMAVVGISVLGERFLPSLQLHNILANMLKYFDPLHFFAKGT